jgi:hypothetical protein
MDLSSLFGDEFLSDFELTLAGPGGPDGDGEAEAKHFPVHGAVLAGQRWAPGSGGLWLPRWRGSGSVAACGVEGRS